MAGGIIPVILCGGSGTRLWPISRKELPKQFAPVLGSRSLFEATLSRAARLAASKIICVGAEDHRHEIQLRLGDLASMSEVILEPEGKNTAAAIAIALSSLARENPEAVVMAMPCDHLITDEASFYADAEQAAYLARAGNIVTFGINPDAPATGFGYIERGEALSGAAHRVARFQEKPDAERAAALIKAGALWNSGIYAGSLRAWTEAFKLHAPDILQASTSALALGKSDGRMLRPDRKTWQDIRSISIDHAIAEKSANMAVIRMTSGWSDVGTWEALAKLDPANNIAAAATTMIDCENTIVRGSNRVVAAIGLKNVMIVDTPDAILVANRERSEEVKQVVAALAAQGREEVIRHRRVARPWGFFESLDRGPLHQVKRITVSPGARLSLQYHHHRAEHWIVVKGTAKVRCGEKEFLLRENQSTYIPLGAVHQLENPGTEPLELIEVQTGTYLGEDDIVRLDDIYGRETQVAINCQHDRPKAKH